MNTLEMKGSSSPVSTIPPSKQIKARLDALRLRRLWVAVATGWAIAVAVLIELLAVAMFLDWWLDLPWSVRALLLAGHLFALGYILYRLVVLPLLRQPDEDELALLVEKARPQLRGRLIAAVQLTRPGSLPPNTAASLVDATVEETETLVRPMNFQSIVSTDRLKKFGMLAVFILLLGVGGFIQGREVCQDLLKRVFLSNVPVPRKTQVLVLAGDKVIGQGDSVRLEAWASGIVPAEGKIELRYENRRPQEFNLEQNSENRAQFGRTIQNVQESFTYVVYLNDGVSPPFQVTALPRPAVASLECLQVYPAYTRLPAASRHPGDLTLLAGSTLELKITATKNIRQAHIRLVGPDQLVPVRINPTNQTLLSGSFSVPASGMNGFAIKMIDTDNMESLEAAVYRVAILPDSPPSVRITAPERKEELVTSEGTVLIGMAIKDDHFIAKVRLHYLSDALNNGQETHLELDLDDDLPQSLSRVFPLSMSRLHPFLLENTLIEYWVEAQDNNDVTGPGVGRSDRQLIRIVSADEKRAELLNRAGDFLSGIEEVAQDQTKANRGLGSIILEKTPASPR